MSLYEIPDSADDLGRILGTLNSLTRDPEVQVVFRVLANSLLRYTPPEDHLMLPLDAGDDANSPMTARHMEMYARRSAGFHACSRSPESLQSIFPEVVDDDEGFVDGIFDDDYFSRRMIRCSPKRRLTCMPDQCGCAYECVARISPARILPSRILHNML